MSLQTITYDADKWQIVPKVATYEMSEYKNTAVHHPIAERIYDAMLAAAPQPPELSPWRSIESAPKDGARILGYDGDYYFCCHYNKDFGRFISGFAPDPFDASKMFILEVSPTHWMPLPLPQAPEVE